jgi:hypothetical protein
VDPSDGGAELVEVARQAGHSLEACLRTYAHTFEEFDPPDRQPAEAVIPPPGGRRAIPPYAFCTRAPDKAQTENEGFGSTEPSRRRDSNPRPPLYESGALAN